MKMISWHTDTSRGYPIEVAHFGCIELTLTEAGAHTIGANVYTGTVAGRVCCVSASRAKAEHAIEIALRVEVLRLNKLLAEGDA
jgi:hypothetical protein